MNRGRWPRQPNADASGTALPAAFQPTDWFRSLTPNFAPQDLTMDMDALKADYKSKINLLNSLKAELRVLVTKNVSNETIADLQKTYPDVEEGCWRTKKIILQRTDRYTERNMVKLAFEIHQREISSVLFLKIRLLQRQIKKFKIILVELFGLSATALKSMLRIQ